MLVTKQCPHTGAVNLYSTIDPHLPVATIMARGAPRRFYWWCHAAEGRGPGIGSGIAIDLKTATALVADEVERATYYPSVERH
jgi:hypothetical protein